MTGDPVAPVTGGNVPDGSYTGGAAPSTSVASDDGVGIEVAGAVSAGGAVVAVVGSLPFPVVSESRNVSDTSPIPPSTITAAAATRASDEDRRPFLATVRPSTSGCSWTALC
ncbi:MAG: hypothetical protein V9G12_19430 [Microthrixaceae bacterium]